MMLKFIINQKKKEKEKEKTDLFNNIKENILNPTQFELMQEIITRCIEDIKVDILKYESQ